MRCIFCKGSSENSKSVEHIVPESLGNSKNILPKGIVCDTCNNYFSRKVEGPLLNSSFFKNMRARNAIESKKGKLPIQTIDFINSVAPSYLHRFKKPVMVGGKPLFGSLVINDHDFLINTVLNPQKHSQIKLISEEAPVPLNDRIVSRFLGKVGLEAITQRIIGHEGADLNVFIDDPGLDAIRGYSRFDKGNFQWPYHVRRIHAEDQKFYYPSDLSTPVDILYGYELFQLCASDFYLRLNIKGYQFVMNMMEPSTSSYLEWIKSNDDSSSLTSLE